MPAFTVSEWLPNAWPPDYLLTADSPPKGNDDTSFIPYAMAQKHVKMVNRTFYSPRKTFLWYTGELHANENRNGIKVDYEVRSKREVGFCQGEMQVVEHGTEFGPVDMNRLDRTAASYLPNRVCDWVISAPYGHKINLELRKMNFLPGDRLTIDDECVTTAAFGLLRIAASRPLTRLIPQLGT